MERQKLVGSSEPCLGMLPWLKEQRRKLRRCRMAMRACVQWLKILFKRRRRSAAADVCLVRVSSLLGSASKVLLRQIGEWVRMRGALKQFAPDSGLL